MLVFGNIEKEKDEEAKWEAYELKYVARSRKKSAIRYPPRQIESLETVHPNSVCNYAR